MNFRATLCLGLLLCVKQVNCIVGGKQVVAYEAPYYVMIQSRLVYTGKEKEGLFCGGVIVNDYWILTLASCIPRNPPEPRFLYSIGENADLNQTSATYEQVIYYPGFIRSTQDSILNDLAMVKVREPFDFNKNHPAMAFLPRPCTEDNGDYRITGVFFGSEGAHTQMHQATVPTSIKSGNVSSCLSTIPFVDKFGKEAQELSKLGFCAGAMGVGACRGDAGGPLVATRKGIKGLVGETVLGIIPWTVKVIECTNNSDLNVYYPKLDAYTDWIESTMTFEKRYYTSAP